MKIKKKQLRQLLWRYRRWRP